MSDKHSYSNLLREVIQGRLSPNDIRFKEWLEQSDDNRLQFEQEVARLFREIQIGNELNDGELWNKINDQICYQRKRSRRFVRIMKYVAILLLPVCVGIGYFLLSSKSKRDNVDVVSRIAPGNRSAVLTLSGGKQVGLGKVDTLLQEVNGTRISLQSGGEITYKTNPRAENDTLYNTIQVPLKGEFDLMLADGTKIWLASASRITYPVVFVGSCREVYLEEGEAFFEVAPNKEKPFVVRSGNFSVKALGTSFNIMNYKDEPYPLATLSTGKVEVCVGEVRKMLEPGHQAIIKDGDIRVREVNLTPYTSWMNDRFYFSNEELEVIMRKISRWYGVDVVYESKESMNYHFTGNLPKYSEISKVFDLLSLATQVKFRIEGKTIVVSNN